jgi:hypothetical protein
METCEPANGPRARSSLRAMLVTDAAAANTDEQSEAHETDDRISARASLALIVLSSLALWALIWFALTRVITNWP